MQLTSRMKRVCGIRLPELSGMLSPPGDSARFRGHSPIPAQCLKDVLLPDSAENAERSAGVQKRFRWSPLRAAWCVACILRKGWSYDP